MSSKNPVLKNITDYLIEEASAEEEELLGMSGDHEEGQLGGDGDGPIERDPTLIKVDFNSNLRRSKDTFDFLSGERVMISGARQIDPLLTGSSLGRLL